MKTERCTMCRSAIKENDSWYCVHPDNEDVRLIKGHLYGRILSTGVCPSFENKHPQGGKI
jgi:hypothetical protein